MNEKSLLFENYEEFIKEEEGNLATPEGASRLIREDASYNDFVDTLVEGLDDETAAAARVILDQQRLQLLSEGANVGASVFSHKNVMGLK